MLGKMTQRALRAHRLVAERRHDDQADAIAVAGCAMQPAETRARRVAEVTGFGVGLQVRSGGAHRRSNRAVASAFSAVSVPFVAVPVAGSGRSSTRRVCPGAR